MPKPTPEEIAAHPFYPPLTAWQEAYGLVDAAIKEHPRLKKLPVKEQPMVWPDPDRIELRAATPPGVAYCLPDKKWWVRITNPRQARILADFLVDGLREAIREARARERQAR